MRFLCRKTISALGDYEVDRMQVEERQRSEPSITNSTKGVHTGFPSLRGWVARKIHVHEFTLTKNSFSREIGFLLNQGSEASIQAQAEIPTSKSDTQNYRRDFFLSYVFRRILVFSVLVFITREVHPFPFRTRKLSHVVPMVLQL